MRKWIAVVLTMMLVSAVFAQTGIGVKLFGQSPAALFQYRMDKNFAVEVTGMYSELSSESGTTNGMGVIAAGKYYLPLSETLQPYIGGGLLYISASSSEVPMSIGVIGFNVFAGIELAFPQLPIKAFASLDMIGIQFLGTVIPVPSYQLGVRFDF